MVGNLKINPSATIDTLIFAILQFYVFATFNINYNQKSIVLNLNQHKIRISIYCIKTCYNDTRKNGIIILLRSFGVE